MCENTTEQTNSERKHFNASLPRKATLQISILKFIHCLVIWEKSVDEMLLNDNWSEYNRKVEHHVCGVRTWASHSLTVNSKWLYHWRKSQLEYVFLFLTLLGPGIYAWSPQSGFHPERAWARDMLCCRLSRSVGLCLVFSLKPFQVPGADTKRIKAAAAAAAMPSSLPHALLDALSFS